MFKNRNEAGKILADELREEKNLDFKNMLVISLPRGGVVIGAVLSALLKIPHQALLVKKISLPSDQELALGATGESTSSLFLNQELIEQLGINEKKLSKEIAKIQEQIKKTKQELGIARISGLQNKQVIIVDDGAATGATIKSAIKEVRGLGASRIILGLPVAPQETIKELKKEVDEVIVLEQPELFFAVSEFYEDFAQLTWEEVVNLLKSAH